MRLASVGRALRRTYRDFDRNKYITHAAALAFFFLLSLFPLLIFLASTLAYVPVPGLFEQILMLFGRVVPSDAMVLVREVLEDILQTNRGLLSLGILGAIWAASGGINALISALNIAYDVKEGRSFWKRRLVAIGLTLLTGVMVTIAMIIMTLGPQFGFWLTRHLDLNPVFAAVWPIMRWTLILAFTIFSVEVLYFLGPNVKQRFLAQLPGAVVAVTVWIASSWGLGWYFRHFADFSVTYGALGAVVGLMLWFYISALALLVGAELNAELLASAGERLPEKQSAAPDAYPEKLEAA